MSGTQSRTKKSHHQPCTLQDPQLEASLQAFNDWRGTTPTLVSNAASAPETFSVAAWNMQRIPFAEIMTPSYRKDRLSCIADILSGFDVAAVSERFLHAPNTAHGYATDDNERGRFNWLRPGSNHHGLTVSSDMALTDVQQGHYSVCSANKADCLVKKGFVIARVETPGGPVTVVTTHMDAGREPKDIAARAVHLAELDLALEPYAGKPLVLAGDLNFSAMAAEDNAHLMAFLAKQGLTLNSRQSVKGHDLIASRGLELVNTMEYNAPTLTDHPLLAARFRNPATAAPQTHRTVEMARQK